jgi:hypothetical protein
MSRILRATLFVSLAVLVACFGIAQNPSANDHALASTTRLLQALQQYNQNHNSESFTALEDAAAARQAELLSLMEKDPGAVLQATLPSDLTQHVPAAVASMLEQRVRVRGEAEVTVEDGRNYSKIHYGLKVAGKRLELHFADHAPNELLTGMILQVEGVQVGEQLVTSSTSSTTSAQGTVSVVPNSFGAQNTAVILVNFQDEAIQPVTPSYVYGTVFTNSYSVNNYWLENSFQQTWITGDVFGWFTIPVSYTTCNTSSIASYADQAATAAGVNLSAYAHKVYVFPNNACTWWGYSTIGGSPTQSWIRDYTNSTSGVAVMNLSHELGHALGLYHSHGLNCGSVPYAATGCSNIEYGDTLDFMGNSNYVTGGDYNSFQKERLGWINNSAQPPIQTVSSTGTYSISPYEAQDGNTKALKIPASNGAYYYVEYREAMGYDNFLTGSYSGVATGVVVHLATPGTANSSNLLNMVPTVTGWTSPALAVGSSYTDSGAGITITPTAVSSTGASVQVTFGTAACTHADPSISVLAPATSLAPGTTANFGVTVQNNDTPSCSSSMFTLGQLLPSGWNGSYNSSAVTLTPGSSTNLTLAVTSPSSTPPGTYTVTVNTANSVATAYSASASAAASIYQATPVSVTLTTNKASYSAGQTVSINVSVMSGTSPTANASVAVNLTKPNGSVVNLSGTTGSNGAATVTYKLKKQDPRGTWQVSASSSAGSAATSFTVQ